MRGLVDVVFVIAILGVEMYARPEAWIVTSAAALWLIAQTITDRTNRTYHLLYCVLAAIAMGYMGIYILNPTHAFDGALGLVPVTHHAWLPGSAHPELTSGAWSFAVSAVIMGGLGLRLGRVGVHILFFMLIAAGCSMALLVLDQRWAPNPYQIFPRTGWFAYENHYAAFANLILPLMLATGLHCLYATRQKGWMAIGVPLFLAGAGLMVVSIYYARSRAALAISGLIVAAIVVQQIWYFAQRSGRFRIPGWLVIAPVAAALLVAGWQGVYQLWGAPSRLVGELGYRGQIVMDTVSILRDHPVWGTGPGTFVSVFPYYQSGSIGDRVINQAHCDPVQFFVEYGLAGATLFACIIAWLVYRRPYKAVPDARYPSFHQLEASAMAIGVAGMMVHSLVDFPWRNGLLALMGFLYASIWLGSGARTEIT